MKLIKWTLALLLTLTLSCSSIILAVVGTTVAVTTSGIGLPLIAVAGITSATIFGTDLYLDSLESHRFETPPQSPVARLIYELRKLGGVLIWGALVIFVIIPLVTRKGRKGIGKLLRTITGNSAPKKWVDEHQIRLDTYEQDLEDIKSKLSQ